MSSKVENNIENNQLKILTNIPMFLSKKKIEKKREDKRDETGEFHE